MTDQETIRWLYSRIADLKNLRAESKTGIAHSLASIASKEARIEAINFELSLLEPALERLQSEEGESSE